jgi:serine/threonine protein kinase
MTLEATLREHSAGAESELAALVDQLISRMRAGDPVDQQQVIAEHPRFAARLRDIFPGLRAVCDLSRHTADATSGIEGDANDLLAGVLGEFRILREIGRGGMGIVYEAIQTSLNRRVALKVLPLAAVLDPRHLQRFKNEALAAASLDHPNIVPVHAVGCERGVHFFAMRYVEGQSLAAVIEGLGGRGSRRADGVKNPATPSFQPPVPSLQPHSSILDPNSSLLNDTLAAALPTVADDPLHPRTSILDPASRDFYRRVAELGIQAAEALDHAHQLGILHRDIKPANLLVECSHPRSHLAPRDETSPASSPEPPASPLRLYISDFGLARLPTEAGMTLTGDLMGTLRYMSPEQARGEKLLDQRTDIYSLGVTLYELVARRPAFPENDRQLLIQHVIEREPRRLRSLDPRIPADLETIVLKAMAKDPLDRYTNAAELAADLRRFIADQPIRARQPTPFARAVRWSRRRPRMLLNAIGTLGFLLLVVSAAFFAVADEKGKTKTSLDQKSAALQKSEVSLRIAREAVDSLYVDLGEAWMANHSKESAVQREFLQRAVQFYENLADESGQDLRTTARAYARIGKIRSYLREEPMAVRALEQSIALGHKLVQSKDGVPADQIELAQRYRQLHDVFLKLGQTKEAGEALSAGWRFVESLPEDIDAGTAGELENIHWIVYRASNALRQQQVQQAERLSRSGIELTRAIFRSAHANLDLEMLAVTSRRILAESLLDQAQQDEARTVCEEALRTCRIARVGDKRDFRPLTELEVSITTLLADIDSQQERYEHATNHYRQGLALLREGFEDRKSPAVINQHMFLTSFGGDGGWDGTYDPDAFCAYAEIQVKLAKTLITMGRRHEAECELGEILSVMEIVINSTGRNLRYVVVLANAYAVSAELCRDWLPRESPLLLDTAIHLWHVALQSSEVASEFKSGVHGRTADLDWFRQTFGFVGELPPPAERKGRFVGPAKHHYFVKRALAVAALHAGRYQDSARMLSVLSEERETNKPFDWLYVAMAHAHLGQHKEAQGWFDRSLDKIASAKDPPPEVIEFRDKARSVLEEKRIRTAPEDAQTD